MSYYPGSRRIFEPRDPDIPSPGRYDPYSPEAKHKKYGFISQKERFPAKSEENQEPAPAYSSGQSVSRTGNVGSMSRRPVGNTAVTAMRAEEGRLKREIEHHKKLFVELQSSNDREIRMLKEKVRQTEDRTKDMLRERSEIKNRLVQIESELRTKERDRDMLAAQLQKQQATAITNPKAEKHLREKAEQAEALCEKYKIAIEKIKQVNEVDKRKLRQLEHQLRKLEQEKEVTESELMQVNQMDYPRQLVRAKRELREQEEQYREKVRKHSVMLQEARDLASRYMNELGEATVHNTALENELQLAKEREQEKATGTDKQLDSAMVQLSTTQRRLTDLERLSAQRAKEAERLLDAAKEHVEELKAEIERLEQEREQVQKEMQGRIRELTRDYQAAKREFESSVKGADSERTKRLHDTQARLELSTKETIDLKAEVSELRGILLKKEMAWKDQQLGLEGDLHAAASDYEALQRQVAEQHEKFNMHQRNLEEQLQKKERAWNAERTGILEKLDTAHKDGFRLRDELDSVQKEAAQVRADCEADLKRMGQDLVELQNENEARAVEWNKERKELARVHTEELSMLKEECALLEQQLSDDRHTFEDQLQDAHYELDTLKGTYGEQMDVLKTQLTEATDSLEKQVLAKQILEEQLVENGTKAVTRITELETELEETRIEHEQGQVQLQDELCQAEQKVLKLEDSLYSERLKAEPLEAENDQLRSRVDELAAINEEQSGECTRLQEMVAGLADGTAQADTQRDEALAHYTGLMQALADKHRAEKAQWEAEQTSMQRRLERYKHREGLWVIQDQYMQQLLEAREDARLHMVQEARELYCELQDEAAMADQRMDVGLQMAGELSSLALPSSSAADLEQDVADMRESIRHAFIEDMQRSQEAQISRMLVDNELQELKFRQVQGQIVETASEMSTQHKAERARYEAELVTARNDYRSLQDRAATNCSTLEAQIAELKAKISELAESNSSSQEAAQLQADNAALAGQVQQLTDLNVGLEEQLEAFEYAVDDERTEYERQRLVFESRSSHMTKVLEQCEVNMATQVSHINTMSQRVAELESERAIMAEQTQFQINWLKENYSKAYQDLDSVLNNGSGHGNLRQRIKYVENLRTQILSLKKENFESARDRDRYKHHVSMLKSELNAYKEVGEADAYKVRSHVRGRPISRRGKSVSRRTLGADAGEESQRAALERKGAAVASRALEEARQLRQQQMAIVDE
ncbi:hypothetical protein H4R24_000894 [Coemansia sp. RSA 988]|nr:hypothetical protein H4R24_000894 [Coemansia sp. RSA 988]